MGVPRHVWRPKACWVTASGLRGGVTGLAVLFGLATFGVAGAAESRGAAPAPRSLAELRGRIETHVGQARFRGALWSVRVDSLETGKTLFAHHPERLMSPASNSKLYTGALALDVLGPEYRIVTPIFATGRPEVTGVLRGDVVVSGRGDPGWKSENRREDFWRIFEPFVGVLKAAGVRRITGDLVADATFFRGAPNGAGWTADDLNDYYGAEISAVSLEDNFADARVVPGARMGEKCHIELQQPHSGLVIDNRLTTGAADGTRQVAAQRLIGENVVHFFGQLPLGGKEENLRVTVPRPAEWFARALKEALARSGIAVEGRPRSVRWPDAPAVADGAVRLGEVRSAPMRELVAAFMKPSQNLETDLVFAHIGEARRTAATPARRDSESLAVEALREFLVRQRLPAEEVRFEEGSGLSRNNLTTANATVGLLTVMTRHPAAKEFADSLPVAGVDGTLRTRMKGTAAEGNVRAKTGSLRYANTLSGYVTSAAGERLVFSLMLNRNTGQPANRNVREELDDVAVLLAQFAGRSE